MREELAQISVFFFSLFFFFLFCKIIHRQTSNLVIFFSYHLSILMHQLVLLDHSRAPKVFRSSFYSSCVNAVDPFRQICTLANSYSDEIDLFFGERNYTFKNTLYNVLYYSITMPGLPALNRPSVLLLLFTQLFTLFLLRFFSLYRYLLSWYSLFSFSFPLYTTSSTIIFVPKKVLNQFNKLNENYINCVTGFIFSCPAFVLSFSKSI